MNSYSWFFLSIFLFLILVNWLEPPIQCWRQVVVVAPLSCSWFQREIFQHFTSVSTGLLSFCFFFFFNKSFSRLRNSVSNPSLLRVFIMIGNEFYQIFSCTCWDDHRIFLFYSVHLVNYMDWFSTLQPTLQCWHEPNLIMTYWPFYISLNID